MKRRDFIRTAALFGISLADVSAMPAKVWSKAEAQHSAHDYDVVVVGATPSGIAAAVNAASQGLSVALIEESGRIGGLTASGLSNSDFKYIESVQGTFRDFMNRVVQIYRDEYGPSSAQVKECYQGGFYEPRIALRAFQEMMREQTTLTLLLQHRLVAAVTSPGVGGRRRLRSIRLHNLDTPQEVSLSAEAFIDATYEGDLMAAARVPFVVGREGRKEYGELFAGKLFYSDGKFLIGSSGEGDRHVQCYNFRITMTDDPLNRVAIVRPPVYQRAEYAPIIDWIRQGRVKAVDKDIVLFRYLPNHKADVNDIMRAPISLRLLGENDEWPEGTSGVRQRIYERFKNYSLGLFYFLQNDPEVPTNIRDEARRWGLCRDEYLESEHFPPFLYVREGRRMKGAFVFTENDTQPQLGSDSVRAPLFKDAIAVGDYGIDSHGELPPEQYHPGVTDGSFGFPTVPFQVPYRVLLPPNVDGLLVSAAVSASHVGFSAIRMEPTWTAIGQAAGLAAALAVKTGTQLRSVDVNALQKLLHERNAITIYFSDVTPQSKWFRVAQYFGTRGYFQSVFSPRDVSWRAAAPAVGQWKGPVPLHDANLDQPLTEALRATWIKLSNLPPGTMLPPTGSSRGEFLEALYRVLRR